MTGSNPPGGREDRVRRAVRATLPVAVLLLTTVGCGGSASGPRSLPTTSGSTTGPTPAPTVESTLRPSLAAATPTPDPTPPPLTVLPALPTGDVATTKAAAYQAVLDGLVSSGSPDAIAAVITADGRWAGAAGVDGPKSRAARPDDSFAIASVSKTLLAAVVMKLVEDGKIDLDAPLATYLGDLAVDANGATVRQALAMRSGLDDTVDGAIAAALQHCDHALSTAEVLATIPKPSGPPGVDYRYSNPTYKLLQFAVEHASGQPFQAAMKATILRPAGVDRVVLQGPGSSPPKPWALPLEGHTDNQLLADVGRGDTLPCLGFSSLSLAASGIASDAPTLATWGWQLFAGKVLRPTTLATMATVDRNGHGLGIDQFFDFTGETVYGHSGSLNGYAAILAVLPERRAVIVVLTNDASADTVAMLGKLIVAVRG